MAQTKKTASKNLHKVILGDARSMAEIPDGTAHLVVTSPPEWSDSAGAIEQYMAGLTLVWEECMRVLQPGCMMCVHLKDGVRAAYPGAGPASAILTKTCVAAGFEPERNIIWHPEERREPQGTITEETLFPRGIKLQGRDDLILIFKKPGTAPTPDTSSAKKSKLTKKEMMRLAMGLWVFPDAADEKPEESFPIELVQRLVKIYSYVGETVLDPFLGSGTTVAAARDLGRSSIGYEINRSLEDTIYEKVAAGHSMRNFVMEVGALPDPAELDRRMEEARRRLFPETSRSSSFSHSRQFEKRHERTPWKKKYHRGGEQAKEHKERAERGGDDNKTEIKTENRKQQDRQVSLSIAYVLNINLMRTTQGADVKLLGVDVPGEFFSRNPGLYRRAMDYLKSHVEGKTIQARRPDAPAADQNSYYLNIQGSDTVNGNLIRFGFALSDRTADHPLRRKFDYFEHEARKNDMGIWALRKTDTPRTGK